MEYHSESGDGISFPLSLAEGKDWVKRFEEFSGELSGVWTQAVNDAYDYCFDVDLVKMGCMKIGSQLDAYFTTLALRLMAAVYETISHCYPSPTRPATPSAAME
jgi:hypothetical protein